MRFSEQPALESLYSSYQENHYGELFYALARVYRPLVCVELGVLEGYSLCWTALALRDNGLGVIHGYDLWEKYPYRHTTKQQTQATVDKLGLQDHIHLYQADVHDVACEWEDRSIDWVHVDISNDGQKVDWAFSAWGTKLKRHGLLLLEGGSQERDQVQWMIKYDRLPINPVLWQYEWGYQIITFQPYPSLTVCRKMWGR